MVAQSRLLCLAALASFCANWQFAFQITYVNTAARGFHKRGSAAFRVSHNCTDCEVPSEDWTQEWSVIIASFYPGSVLGFLLMPALVSRLGTKTAMAALSLPALLGCSLQLLPFLSQGGSLLFDAALCGGRLLVGIQGGAALCFLPLYIIEISPPPARSLLNTFQQVSQAFGTLVGLILGCEFILPFGSSRVVVLQIVAAAPTVLLIILLASTPPTPHYLLMQGADITDVLSSLSYYQGASADLLTLQNEVSAQTIKNSPRGRIPWSSWKGFLVGSLAASSYAFTADDLIDTFSAHILHAAQGKDPVRHGYSIELDHSVDIMSIVLGFVLLIGSLLGSLLIDRYGRRRLLLFGLVGTAAWNGMAAAFIPTSPSAVLLFFGLTKLSIGLGAGHPAWFLTSELVSLPFVPLFQSLSTGLLLCSCMVVTFFFLPLSLISPVLSILILSTIPASLIALLLFLFLPETKDKSSRHTQLVLQSNIFSGLSNSPYNILISQSNADYGTIL